MNLFIIIWIMIMILCFFKKGMKYITFFTLLFMTFQCASVLTMNDSGIGPQIFTSILFIIKFFLESRGKIKIIRKSEFKIINFFILSLFFIIIYSSIKNEIITFKLLQIIQLLVYIICYFCMRKTIDFFTSDQIYSMLRKIIVIICIIGVIQLLTTVGLLPLRSILKHLLYNDNDINIYFNFNDSYHNKRLYAMFMEPSYLAGFLVGGFYYILSFKEQLKKNMFLLSLILFEIVMTTSSTAYVALILVGVIFLLRSKQFSFRTKFIICFGALISCLILYFGFYDLLDEVIFSKSASGSGITRARWNVEAYEAYLSSPIYGVGYKCIRGSSIYYSLLGQLGFIGFICFTMFIVASIYKLLFSRKYKKYVYYYAAMYGVLSVVICQFIACPDLDLCTLWLWLYILALSEAQFYKEIRNFYDREVKI